MTNLISNTISIEELSRINGGAEASGLLTSGEAAQCVKDALGQATRPHEPGLYHPFVAGCAIGMGYEPNASAYREWKKSHS